MLRPLAALAKYENGYPFKPGDFEEVGTPVVRIKQLLDERASLDRTQLHLPSRYRIDDGDLIFSWSGTLAVRTWSRGSAYLNQHLFRVDPLPIVERSWLKYALMASVRALKGMMHGSAMTHITRPILKQSFVQVPDLDEQRRIADFLDGRVARIDQIIAARREQVEALHVLQQSRNQVLYDRLVARWGEIRLGLALRRLEQGWSPQADSTPATVDEWGVMRAGCVNAGVFDPSDNKRLPPELEARSEYEIRPGDLLMSRASGSLDLIGSIAIVPADVRPRLVFPDKIYRLTLGDSWAPEFVAPMLRVHSNRETVRLGVSGAEGMANNLPSQTIRNLHIPIVPHSEQIQAVHFMAGKDTLTRQALSACKNSIALLSEHKESLITSAVTGEFDVTTASTRVPGE